MNLHDQIMNIRCDSGPKYDTDLGRRTAYNEGHLTARHLAALLAIEADVAMEVACKHAARQASQIREQRELITQLNAALEDLLKIHVYTDGFVYPNHDPEDSSLVKRARAALSAVREYDNG